MSFLPLNGFYDDFSEVQKNSFDFICVTGDAYVDHPSFGIAIIARILENLNFRVGVIAQPLTNADYSIYGEPKYAFMVTGGQIDSMVANYTVAGRFRNRDEYSPLSVNNRRPDHAVDVYSKKLKELFPESDIVLGGLEASLRRFAHYDYHSNKILPSILLSSGADILVYGAGENPLKELCNAFLNGLSAREMKNIRGTCVLAENIDDLNDYVLCPSLKEVKDPQKKRAFAIAARKQYDEQDFITGKTLVQRHSFLYLIQYPPAAPLTSEKFDAVYELPYEKSYHPFYNRFFPTADGSPSVASIKEVEFSITHNRGCFGFCNFCSLAFHQGRIIQTRSKRSIIREIENLTKKSNFKGYIHDIGGPTAQFRTRFPCEKSEKAGFCKSSNKNKKCLFCPNLKANHSEYLDILRSARNVKGVKKVFVRSGIRYDYLMRDKKYGMEFLRELTEFHIGGQLKVAPEHTNPPTLDLMGKPSIDVFLDFKYKFEDFCKQCNKEQYLVPYFMSSHPGTTSNAADELSDFMKKHKIRSNQVQDFYPTPGTLSTAMFYSELNPYTLEKVYVPKTKREKQSQRDKLQYFKNKNSSKKFKKT